MFGFGKVKGAPEVGAVLQRMSALESAFRTLEQEQIAMHDQVRKWMRRAVAAERAAGRNQEPEAGGRPATPGPQQGMTSARARALRQGRAWGGRLEPEDNGNGVHS